MFTHQTQTRVRYAETDQMGYVYYGNYATYYEVARVEGFRHLGIPYRALEDQGIMMPVYEMQTRFIHAALYDDLISLEVSIPQLPSVRIIFEYKIHNEAGTLLNTGSTTLVFFDQARQKLIRCPDFLLEKLKPFF